MKKLFGKKDQNSSKTNNTNSITERPDNKTLNNSPLSIDCWVEVCKYLLDSDILNLCLSHRIGRFLINNESLWQNRSFVLHFDLSHKKNTETWKSFYQTCRQLVFRLDEDDFSFAKNLIHVLFGRPNTKGIIHYIATHRQRGVAEKRKNPIVQLQIALVVKAGWYSITGTSSDPHRNLWLPADEIHFPASPGSGRTFCTCATGERIIFDFGRMKVLPTYLIWSCDYNPEVFLASSSISIEVFSFRHKRWFTVPIKKILETPAATVKVLQLDPDSKFRFPSNAWALRNLKAQTLTSGVEFFGNLYFPQYSCAQKFSIDPRVQFPKSGLFIDVKFDE